MVYQYLIKFLHRSSLYSLFYMKTVTSNNSVSAHKQRDRTLTWGERFLFFKQLLNSSILSLQICS